MRSTRGRGRRRGRRVWSGYRFVVDFRVLIWKTTVIMLYKDGPRVRTDVVLIYTNYNIATGTHSKTVIYNRFRMYNVKTNFCSPIYKIATTPYSNWVLNNRRRWRVVNRSLCSSVVDRDGHAKGSSGRPSGCALCPVAGADMRPDPREQ